MTRANSPYYAQGIEDGNSDKALMGCCPGMPPAGMNPEMSWSVMYQTGYWEGFEGAMMHRPCPNCSKQKEET